MASHAALVAYDFEWDYDFDHALDVVSAIATSHAVNWPDVSLTYFALIAVPIFDETEVADSPSVFLYYVTGVMAKLTLMRDTVDGNS